MIRLVLTTFVMIFILVDTKNNNDKDKATIQFNVIDDSINTTYTIYSTSGVTVERKFIKKSFEMKCDDDDDDDEVMMYVVLDNVEEKIDLNSVLFKAYMNDVSLEINELLTKEIIEKEKIDEIMRKIEDLKEKMEEENVLKKKFVRLRELLDATVDKSETYSQLKDDLKHYIETRDEYSRIININDAKIKDIQVKIDNLKKEKEGFAKRYNIIIQISLPKDVEVNKKKQFMFELSYNIENVAKWKPSYVLRIDSQDGIGKLEYYGNIVQYSGKDWVNSKIFLSNSNLNTFKSPPETKPTMVSLNDPNFYAKNRRGFFGGSGSSKSEQKGVYRQLMSNVKEVNMQMSDDDMSTDSFEEEESMTKKKSLKSSSHIVGFEIEKLMNISSSRTTKTKVTISPTVNVESKFLHYFFPQQSQSSYVMLFGSLDNMVLIPGIIDVIVDGSFVSKVMLDENVISSGVLELWIGVDKLVNFKKIPVKTAKKKHGIFTTSYSETRLIETIIENKKDVPVNLTIVDSLPFPQDERITILIDSPFKITKPIKELINNINEEGYNIEKYIDNSSIRVIRNVEDSDIGKLVLINEETGNIFKISKDYFLERNFLLKEKERKVLSLKYTINWTGNNIYFVK